MMETMQLEQSPSASHNHWQRREHKEEEGGTSLLCMFLGKDESELWDVLTLEP